MLELPFSQSCENNKKFILEVLATDFADSLQVLEIGSGTGQHACYFAAAMPWLCWQPSDVAANQPLLGPRCDAYEGGNLLPPVVLDVTVRPWSPEPLPDAIFTANSLHIMPWSAVVELFAELGQRGPARHPAGSLRPV